MGMALTTLNLNLGRRRLAALTFALAGVLIVPQARGQNPAVDAASVVNAAGYLTTDYPNGGIAQGSTFIVKSSLSGACGTKLATSFPLQTNMGGTSIKITMGSASFDAPMVYVVACTQTGLGTTDQLAAIMPSNVPTGTGTLTVTFNGKTSTPVPVKVIDRGFEIFTINQAGTGPAIVQNFNSQTDTPINTFATSAKPNQVAILWGTGLGPDGNPDANAPKPTDIPIALELFVGGKQASLIYKGRSGCCSGIDQVVFTVPDGLDGCYVPIVARIGNMVSNFGTLAVAANGGPCSDPYSFSASDVQTAQSNGHLRLGFVDLFREEGITPASPGATQGVVFGFDLGFSQFADLPFGTFIGLPSRVSSVTGGCIVLRQGSIGSNDIFGPPMLLNAGSYKPGSAGPITYAGPRGTVTSNPQGTSDPFLNTALGPLTGFDPPNPNLPFPTIAFLEPGNVSVNAAGGNLVTFIPVGSISTQIGVPATVDFTNRYSFPQTVDLTSTVSVTWNPATAGSRVLISGTSLSALSAQPGPHADFYCVANGNAGQFTLPSYVLQSLPPSFIGQQGSLQFGLGIGQLGSQRFNSTGLDAAFLRYNITVGRSLGWK